MISLEQGIKNIYNQNMKQMYLLTAVILVFSACSGDRPALRYDFNTEAGVPSRYPNVRFAVISDLHVYDLSLGSSGAAFDRVKLSDRKLLLDSIDLLDFAIDRIIESGVSFVLIPGDLTKDGELINHQIAAQRFSRLTDAGIAVYVVPGNHDVNILYNAVRFIDDRTEPVPTVSEQEFAQIYGGFGYNAALFRDDHSLSYAAELADGLWLLAIDACRHRENIPGRPEFVSGKISQETADWIAKVLREAKRRDKAVMALMHHGVVEHWDGQAKLHPEYLINDFVNFGRFLASWDVRVVFTGHYHAQDIVRASFGEKFIYDVETGSLVTAPCPIRFIEINNNVMYIQSETIVDKIHPGTDFAANAHEFVKNTIMLEAAGILRRYRVSEKDIAIISEAVGYAFIAHYNGDEDPAMRPHLDKSKLGLWGRFILSQQQYVLDGLWRDLPPADNNVNLQL
jgi:predicted phosphodiesterase